jgi:hypothetical protein
MTLPDALMQSVFSDYVQWSYESDFDGHEGMFYVCNLTKQLNEEIGDLEQRVIAFEVWSLLLHVEQPCMQTAPQMFSNVSKEIGAWSMVHECCTMIEVGEWRQHMATSGWMGQAGWGSVEG